MVKIGQVRSVVALRVGQFVSESRVLQSLLEILENVIRNSNLERCDVVGLALCRTPL